MRVLFAAGAVLCLAGCSDDPVVPCEITAFTVSVTGTIRDQAGQTVPLFVATRYSTDLIEPAAFEFLASILGHGAITSGQTAVWGMTGPPGGALLLQLLGSRRVGDLLPILGVMPEALFPGQHPTFSAIPRNALLLQWVTDDFTATTASGEIEVSLVAPLRGAFHAELGNGAGQSRVLDGELLVEREGTGC